MKIGKRFALAISLVLISLAAAYLVFKVVADRWELLRDFIGIAAAYLSFMAFRILSPIRGKGLNFGLRTSAVALLVSICLAFEFGIGAAWYSLDKIVRHYQHS